MSDLMAALNADKSLALIEVEDDDGKVIMQKVLTPAELSVHITELSRLRRAMADPIPRKLDPNPVFTDVTRNAVFHVDRQHALTKEFFVAARHPGYGWLAFTLEAPAGYLLSQMIFKQAKAISPLDLPRKLIT